MARNTLIPAGMLFLGCAVFHLTVNMAVNLPVMAEDEIPVAEVVTPQVARAWVVGNTEALEGMLHQFCDYKLPLTPLPWARYTEDDDTRWLGGTIVAGDKSWNLIAIPISLDKLSPVAQSILLWGIRIHPIGLYFFPDGDVEIQTIGNMTFLVGKDFPNEYFFASGLPTNWDMISNRCYIGWYQDDTVHVPWEESKVAAEDATQGVAGVDWDENSLSFRWIDLAKEETHVAKARQVRLSCPLPHRAGGFIDADSPIYLTHRIFAEDLGLWNGRVVGGSEIIPVEAREGDGIYDIIYRVGAFGSKSSDEYHFSFKKGDITFGCLPQQELPPEDGVPSAEEMNAANTAFWQSLEALIDEIAAKLGSGEQDTPIDIGAKYDDGMLLFAIAWQPGDNEPVIDWNRLKDVDLSHMEFKNPYREYEKPFAYHVDVLDDGQWSDVTFTKLKFEVRWYGEEMSETTVLLGQGPGILCGVVATPQEENAEQAIPPETMRAALESCLEESQRVILANVPAPTETVLRYTIEDWDGGFISTYHQTDDTFVSSSQFFATWQASQMITQFAQMMFGDSFKRFGLSP